MRTKIRFPHVLGFVLGVVLSVQMFGCSVYNQNKIGKSIGTGWVTHNTVVEGVITAGKNGLLDADELENFNSWQSPVYEGLVAATEDYTDGDDNYEVARTTMEVITPMLERLVVFLEEKEAENGD